MSIIRRDGDVKYAAPTERAGLSSRALPHSGNGLTHGVRIYADFDHLGPEMLLGYAGTLRDLSSQQVRLADGLRIILYDYDGHDLMEVDAVVEYRPFASPHPQLQWRARVAENTLRRVCGDSLREDEFAIPCFCCGADVFRQAVACQREGFDFRCDDCGARVLEPYLPVPLE